MKNLRIFSYFILLRSSFWFIPFLMIALALLLAAAMAYIDQAWHYPDSIFFAWMVNIGPSGARAVLSTIAGSTITVAGVIFSIAMVVLTMASSQFGPRLIPTFMRVGKIQFGIGLFVGTFVYCLIMLTFIPDVDKGKLLPVWGVVVGLGLGITAFLVLIMLIHEIATFIQAPNVAERVSADIRATFARIFPENAEEIMPDPLPEWQENYPETTLHSKQSGYIRTINHQSLSEFAEQKGIFLHLCIKPGKYIIQGQKIGNLYGIQSSNDEMIDAIICHISCGSDRTLAQDAEYSIDQMVEIALRALSPGINDPFTAINCIDKLSDALGFLAHRQIAQSIWTDSIGLPRMVGEKDSYHSILNSAFDQIRQHCTEHPAVIIRLVEALERLASLNLSPSYRDEVAKQIETISSNTNSQFAYARDQNDFDKALSRATSLINTTNK